MLSRRAFLLTASSLVACPARAATPYRLQVRKKVRKLDIIQGDRIVKSYKIRLGRVPVGHKEVQGDGRTPEGHYWIDRKNPASAFFLSLGISYPNGRDRANARSKGKSPGGDIFIHGQPNGHRGEALGYDWTQGCIALPNDDMEELFGIIETGCKISIFA